MRHVGALIAGPSNDPIAQAYANAFRDGLAKLGWIEGRNLRLDIRFAIGEPAQTRFVAAELVRLRPDVIFVSTAAPTRAVQQETKTIPIVFAGPRSEVVSVQNIARPEGNTTGFPVFYQSMAGKLVELLKEADPRITRVAVITSPEGRQPGLAAGASTLDTIATAASALGVKVIDAPIGSTTDFERAVDAFAAESNGALIAVPGTYTASRNSRQLMFLLAGKHRCLRSIGTNHTPPRAG